MDNLLGLVLQLGIMAKNIINGNICHGFELMHIYELLKQTICNYKEDYHVSSLLKNLVEHTSS